MLSAGTAYSDDLESLQLLLQRSAKRGAKSSAKVTSVDKNDQTLLHLAASGNAVVVARFLLNRGANPRAKDIYGYEPLQIAAKFNSIAVAGALLGYNEALADAGGNSSTPLEISIDRPSLGMIQLLLPYYPDYSFKKSSNYKLLIAAVEARDKELVEVMLDRGANPNTSYPGQWETILHTAAEYPDVEMVRLLLDNKANPNARSALNETPLHKAVWRGHLQVVSLLLKRAADINAKSDTGTPLTFAKRFRHPEIEKLLVDNGATE